jgi:hypothetical protein
MWRKGKQKEARFIESRWPIAGETACATKASQQLVSWVGRAVSPASSFFGSW